MKEQKTEQKREECAPEDIPESFSRSGHPLLRRFYRENLSAKKWGLLIAFAMTIVIVVFAIADCKPVDDAMPAGSQPDSIPASEESIAEYNEAVRDYNLVADDYNKIREISALKDVDDLPETSEPKAYLDENVEADISEAAIALDIAQILKETGELKDALALAHSVFNQKISEYNEAVKNYNAVVDEYKEIRKVTSLENVDNLPEAKAPRKCLDENSGVSDFIEKAVSQDAILQEIEPIMQETDELLYVLILAQQITNPDENWVIDRLASIDCITDVEAVTKNHDPNQLLNVDGGYTSCVYFSIDGINQTSIEGTGIDKGTDAGGAIEVYKTVTDAQNRCDYLSQFDNTLLYSGSYAILGTTVIRTSYLLTNEQQVELTNEITKAFTALT